jgi:hypothetical protein
VHVRVPVAQVAGGLDDGDHPGPHPLVAGRRAHQLEHGFPGRQRQPAEELPVVQKVRPQHLRNDEDPLRVTDPFEYVLGQQHRRRRRTLRRTRRAQIPRLARKREQVLFGAIAALGGFSLPGHLYHMMT